MYGLLIFLGMAVIFRSFLIGLSWLFPTVPRNVRVQTSARVLIREILVIGMFVGALDVQGKIHLDADAAPSLVISLWRCINRHLSCVEAIRLGRRILIINSEPVTILKTSLATSARVNTLLMIPINSRESTTPVTVPLPP